MFKASMAGLCLALLAGEALAMHTVELKRIGNGLGRNVKQILDGDAQNVFSGEIKHSARNGVGEGAVFDGMTLYTFCTEVTENTSNNWKVFTITDPASTSDPAMGEVKASALNDMYALLVEKKSEGVFNKDMAAAFQAAVWEVIYDYDPDVGRSSLDIVSGRMEFKHTNGNPLPAAIATKVEMFLDAVGSGRGDQNLIAFQNFGIQDQFIPAPGAAALVLAGAAFWSRRRRGA